MLLIGLTGSIGMGKSTTAALFRSYGVPVHDSDRAVHDLYRGAARDAIAAAFPSAMTPDGVDRQLLAKTVLGDPEALRKLENLIHPLVGAHRQAFVDACRRDRVRVAVCDIPLLFETGADRTVDLILVVSATAAVQKARVLARPAMTLDRFDAIIAKQIPDHEKRRRAHVVIDTADGIEAARQRVFALLRAVASVSGRSI